MCTLILEQLVPVCAPDPQINGKIMLVVAARLHCCRETACRQGGVLLAPTAGTHHRHFCKEGYFGSARNHMIPEQMSPGDVALPTSLPKGKRERKKKKEKVEGDFQPAPLAFADEFSYQMKPSHGISFADRLHQVVGHAPIHSCPVRNLGKKKKHENATMDLPVNGLFGVMANQFL